MYNDTIVLFNHYRDGSGTMYWHPIELKDVDVNTSRAVIIQNYGEASADRANIHIKTEKKGGKTYVGQREVTDDYRGDGSISFRSGEEFDFIVHVKESGEIALTDVCDDDFTEGYYGYLNARNKRVYAISSVSEFSVIPHLEVGAK